MPRFEVGQAGRRVRINDGWRVLDVGSGHNPHPRADVLLERWMDVNDQRSGAPIDRSDPRLVEGDALAMPFADRSFDYVIASHIAEHVEDPARLCEELARVSTAGYIETPGWLGDMILRESFHLWRVRCREGGLAFAEVTGPRPFGRVGDVAYALIYAGELRPGHPSLVARHLVLRPILRVIRLAFAALFRLPGIRGLFYTQLEWTRSIPCSVIRKHPVD